MTIKYAMHDGYAVELRMRAAILRHARRLEELLERIAVAVEGQT